MTKPKPTVIALHGDLATPAMLQRDVGDFAQSVDVFFDARGWLRFDAAMGLSIAESTSVLSFVRAISYRLRTFFVCRKCLRDKDLRQIDDNLRTLFVVFLYNHC